MVRPADKPDNFVGYSPPCGVLYATRERPNLSAHGRLIGHRRSGQAYGGPMSESRLRAELTAAGSATAATALSAGPIDDRVRAALLALADHRSPGTTCPSDAARAVGGEGWRDLMELTREIIRDLARRGDIEVTQRGEVLDPDTPWRGPIRVRLTGPR